MYFRKKIGFYFYLFLLVVSLTGCVYLIIGGAGALGGYVVSPDTVEGLTDRDQEEVWDTSLEIVSIMGIITEQLEEGGVLIAKVAGAKVTITILQASPSSVKLTVKARKAFLPKINVAQDVFVKIMSRLTE